MNICARSPENFRAHLRDQLATKRFPLSGTFELTWNCNFRCAHCYLQDRPPEANALSLSSIRTVLDQLADSGCLGISLTGGEPLLHPDFSAILRHAVRRGFLVTVFSNASLVDQEQAKVLADHPPRCIEVSLYGGDESSYRAVTGSGKNFARVLAGIEHLQAQNLTVMLKAMILRPLLGQIDRMRELAQSFGLSIRFDPGVDPTLGGDRKPLQLRVRPDQAIDIELQEPNRRRKLHDYDRPWRTQPATPSKFACGAGLSSFHIDPAGRLMPCLLLRKPALDLTTQGFAHAWSLLGESPGPKYPAGSPCQQCDLGHLCNYCPGLAELGEDPSADGFYCQVTRARAESIRSQKTQSENFHVGC